LFIQRREKRGEEQGDPKLLLAMDPARGCQHRIQAHPHPHQERQEEEKQWIQIGPPGYSCVEENNTKEPTTTRNQTPLPPSAYHHGHRRRGRERLAMGAEEGVKEEKLHTGILHGYVMLLVWK
jgi:hypothetical protein